MELILSLCANPGFSSVVELSLSALFHRGHSSLYKGLAVHQPQKASLNLAELGAPYAPPLWKGRFHLLGIDYTSNPRPHAFQMPDREWVHKATTDKGQKPVVLGHEYHHINLLGEKNGPQGPSWAPPCSTRRVRRRNREAIAIAQMRSLLENPRLPYGRALSIQVGDTQFSTPAYLAAFQDMKNLLTIVRSRANRVYNFPPPVRKTSGRGARPLYGSKMDLKDAATWPQPDETARFALTNYRGKSRTVEIQAWHTVLMRGHRKRAYLPMHRYPFTLLLVRLYDEQMQLLFPKDPLWLIVMGPRRQELSLQEIYEAFGARGGMEHFFRFSKRNLLLDKFQTPRTPHEEHWWQLATLAYLCLWVAREEAHCLPRPWEKSLPQVKEKQISPTMVQRSFLRIMGRLKDPSDIPKTVQ